MRGIPSFIVSCANNRTLTSLVWLVFLRSAFVSLLLPHAHFVVFDSQSCTIHNMILENFPRCRIGLAPLLNMGSFCLCS